MQIIPYGRQTIEEDDIKAVTKTLSSDFITQGKKIDEFEEAVARYCGAKYAVAVSSGTAALHLAALASGLNKNRSAITSPNSFIATSNAILYTQAKPIFADITTKDGNINPDKIEKKLSKKVKAIFPIHFAGFPCDMPRIAHIAKKNNLMVIEDAAHAIGSKYLVNNKWIRIGSCTHSDMTTFSFHPVKAITTGEGGIITTNNKKLYEKLRILRSHGIVKNRQTKNKGPWFYEMRQLGFNCRITDFQCALGISQLKKIARFIKRRREIASIYNRNFQDISSIQTLSEGKTSFSSYHLFVVLIDFKKIKISKKNFMLSLQKMGVGSQVHYIPIYKHPYYKSLYKINDKNYPGSENFYKRCLSLPLYPSLTNKEVSKVIKGVRSLTAK